MLRKRFVFHSVCCFFTTRNVLAILSGVCVIRKLPVILSFVFCITRSMEWFVSQETDFLLFFFKWILYIENAYFVSQKCVILSSVFCITKCVFVMLKCFVSQKNMLSCLLLFQVYFVTNLLAVLSGVFCIARFYSGFYSFIRKSKH